MFSDFGEFTGKAVAQRVSEMVKKDTVKSEISTVLDAAYEPLRIQQYRCL